MRIWGILLAVLLLSGCTQQPPPYEPHRTEVSSSAAPATPPPITASWFDTFDRPDTAAGLGEGWQMLHRLYDPRQDAADGFIKDGRYTYAGNQVVYAVRQYGAPVVRVGAVGRWRHNHDGLSTTMALVICGNDNLITDMLHLVVGRNDWSLTARRNNGAFDPVVNGKFSPPLDLDRDYQFELSATPTTATVTVPGRAPVTKNVDTNGLLGNHAFWEEYFDQSGPLPGEVFDYDKVWAEEQGAPLNPVP